jgi:hypothetical protein
MAYGFLSGTTKRITNNGRCRYGIPGEASHEIPKWVLPNCAQILCYPVAKDRELGGWNFRSARCMNSMS